MLAAVRRGLVRQFVPRHPYRMLIKRVSTVSKYLTAAAARGEATVDRSASAGHGIVFGEPWSLMYASGLARWSRGTVWVVHVLLPRHSPMLRALLCALYTLSLSLSFCLFFPPVLSSLTLSLSLLHPAVFFPLTLSRLPIFPLRSPVRGDTHARNAFSVPLPLPPERTSRFPPRAMRLFPRSFLVT